MKSYVKLALQILGVCVIVGGVMGSINSIKDASTTTQYVFLVLLLLLFVAVGCGLFYYGSKMKKD